MNTKTPDIELIDVLERVQLKVKQDMNCIKVGKIKDFDSSSQTASVELIISKVIDISSDGTKSVRKLPLLVEVPVFVLGGLDSYLQVPVVADSPCIVVFNDDDLDNWLVNDQTTPDTTRKHDLSDAIAIIGIKNSTQERTDFDGEGFKLHLDSDNFLALTTDGFSFSGVSEFKDAITFDSEATFEGDATFNGAVKPDGQEGVDSTIILTDTTAAGLISTTTIIVTKGIITNVS